MSPVRWWIEGVEKFYDYAWFELNGTGRGGAVFPVAPEKENHE
jgi:hypothetical protein